jgi:signal recognition particle receptor subunit beta
MTVPARKKPMADKFQMSPGPSKAAPTSVKIVISGGFGVGKTTMVATLSEIPPLTTEASMTTASVGIDDGSKVSSKTTTTVAMDFGRITIDQEMVLFLFGTPGQDRFAFMWDDLVIGALGAIVLVDLRRIDDCFPAIDYFESRDVPFVIAINHFEGTSTPDLPEVREALDLRDECPVVVCDARSKESVKNPLLALLTLLMKRRRQSGSRRSLG